MKLCGIIYKALLYFVPEITGVKCGKKQRKQGIINFLSVNGKCLKYKWLVRKAAKRRCVKMRTFFFYAQSPDFHKQGLCYYLKILYL